MENPGFLLIKKTIKQFLEPVIEQVWGGGGGCRFLCVSFSELLYFCVGNFQFTHAFFGSILPIFAYFLLYIMCISSRSQTVFWAQSFRDVQLTFFKTSSQSLIFQVLEGIVGKQMPNKLILIQQ